MRPANPNMDLCAIGRGADVIGDRWTLLIMRSALIGRSRFDEFKSVLGIADNVLSNRLARLVDNGLLMKEPYRDGARVRQHYRLTTAGRDLHPVLEALSAWGQKHGERSGTPTHPVTVIHLPCGSAAEHGSYCQRCETAIAEDEVGWFMPWLSSDPIPLAAAADSPAGVS